MCFIRFGRRDIERLEDAMYRMKLELCLATGADESHILRDTVGDVVVCASACGIEPARLRAFERACSCSVPLFCVADYDGLLDEVRQIYLALMEDEQQAWSV